MQENPTTNLIDISSFTCINNKPAVFLCTSEPCQNCALLCGEETCKCFEEYHPNCDFSNLKRLYQRILAKKVNTQQPLDKAFAAIDRLFAEAIDTLSHERDNYVLMKENYGLSMEQAKFLEHLATHNKEQLTGNFISKAQSASKEHARESLLTEQRVNEFWKKQKIKLDNILNKITTLVAYSSDANLRKLRWLQWDEERKISGVEIKERSVIRVMNGAPMQPIAVAQPLKKQNPSIWAFRIKKIMSNVGVGVCNGRAKTSQQTTFGQQNYPGLSMIFSHGQNTENMRDLGRGMGLPPRMGLPPINPPGFNLRSGDLVYMKVNYEMGIIQINKNISTATTTVKLDVQIQNEDLYPACILTTAGDEIQIMDVTKEDQEKLNKLFESTQISSTNSALFGNLPISPPFGAHGFGRYQVPPS